MPGDTVTVQGGCHRGLAEVAVVRCTLVATESLGEALVTKLGCTNPDDSSIEVDRDYFGKLRNPAKPFPGPFEAPGSRALKLMVWPLDFD